jgi:hypothetical protein
LSFFGHWTNQIPESIIDPAWFSFGAALLSAIATLFAALAAYRAPVSAARYSEKLRLENEKLNERRRMKMIVFTTLMQERATINSPESVRVLNLVDTIFADAVSVRESWAELHLLFGKEDAYSIAMREEKIRKLLKDMADDLGISHTLRLDDFGRIYYPKSMADQDFIANRRRELEIQQLMNAGDPSERTPTQDLFARWPPKPSEATKEPM